MKFEEGIKLKQQLSLVNGCTLIIGVIIGSGIFVSPKGVLALSGSTGISLVIWLANGLYTLLGALSYAELGTSIPKSGGDYAYINEAFGHMPAFLFLWIAFVILIPTTVAIISMVFASYMLSPFFPSCVVPDDTVRLLAACLICVLAFVNCYSVKWATGIQNILTLAKILTLVIIIISGIVWLFMGNTEHLQMPILLENSKYGPGQIALAFYSGVFTFNGWNYLNFVSEELKDPIKNLPRAIYISIPIVTLIYVMSNVAYFAVLSTDSILDSEAVAMTYAQKILGPIVLLMPAFVAASCVGSCNGVLFTSSRMFFAGARDGQLPELLSMINLNFVTPMPSIIALAAIAIGMVFTSDVYFLINYTAFALISIVTMAVSGLLWLRYIRPEMNRPIKINLLIPITFVIMSLFLLILPFFENPDEVIVGLLMILSGLPVYLILVHWQNKPRFIYQPWIKLTHMLQKLMHSVPGDEKKL